MAPPQVVGDVTDYQALLNQQAINLQARSIAEVQAEQQARAQALAQQQQAQSQSLVGAPQSISVTTSSQQPNPQLTYLNREISKTESAIKNFARQGMMDRADELVVRLQQLQEARSNLINQGLAYYTVTTKQDNMPQSIEHPLNPAPSNTVFVDNKGYSVAPELQKSFLQQQAELQPQISFIPQEQTIPRTPSGQETISGISSTKIFDNVTPQNTVQPSSEVFRNVKVEDTLSRLSEATGGNPIILVPVGFVKGVAEVGYSLTAGLPQTVENLFNDVTHPSQIMEKTSIIGQKLQQEPALTTGEIAGQLSFGKVLEVGVESGVVPKPVISETIIPTETGDVSIKSLALEYGKGKSFIIGSVKPSDIFSVDIFSKAPDISPILKQMLEGKEIRISGATETKILQESLTSASESGNVVDTNRATEFIPVAQNILRKTENVQSSFIEGFPKTTERLNEQGVTIALDIAKENQGYVSGSFSRSAQLSKNYPILEEVTKPTYYGTEVEKASQGKVFDITEKTTQDYVLNKVPRDIDIHLVDKTPEQIQAIAENTLARFKSAGIDAQLKGEGGQVQNAILVKQPSGQYEKAIEFLGEGTLPKEEVVPDKVLGFTKEGKKIDINGVQTTSLNEELRGVTQGTARLRTVNGKLDIYPPEKRLKDIGSVSVSARTLQQSKMFGKESLLNDIEKYESLYPKELVREQVKLANENPEQVLLADFRSSSARAGSSESPSIIDSVSPSVSSSGGSPKSVKTIMDISFISNRNKSSQGSSSNKSNIPSTSNISSGSNKSSPSTSSSPTSSIVSNILPPTSNISSPSSSTSNMTSPSNIFNPSPSPSTTSGRSTSTSSILPRQPIEESIIPRTSSFFSPLTEQTRRKKRFLAEVKQKGKFVPIGEAESLSEAFSLGRRKVEQTLRASFRVLDEDTGSAVRDIGILPSNLRRSKRADSVFVQLEGNRLASQGERSEIQFAKKIKSKKGIFG